MNPILIQVRYQKQIFFKELGNMLTKVLTTLWNTQVNGCHIVKMCIKVQHTYLNTNVASEENIKQLYTLKSKLF